MQYTDLTADMTVRPELLGLTTLLAPFAQFTSSQRLTMFSNNLPQALVLHGCEPPLISTGFEQKFAKYEYDKTVRNQAVEILAIVPKFQIGLGSSQIQSNPTYTVIYLGEEDHLVGYFDVCSYTKLHNGFGYMNKKLNTHQLRPNNYIPKEMKFVTSPNHDGNFYMQGVNGNVAFLSAWETTDDAFIISRRLQKAMAHTAIKSLELPIRPDEVPLNLYGTGEEYRCFPDIGDTVRDDGIIVAFRERNETTVLSDMTAEALMTPEFAHDNIHYAPPGAEILDVQVFVKPDVYKKMRGTDGTYSQLMKYAEQHNAYYTAIVDTYNKVKHLGYGLSPDFNNLVTRCMGLSIHRNSPRVKLRNKKEEVEFMYLSITYAYTRTVHRGFKITGRDGAKGVVSDVWENEDMPTDDLGFQADLLITSESGFNRMNDTQFKEQDINRGSEIIRMRVRKHLADGSWTIDQAYDYVMGYITDVRELYGHFLRERIHGADERVEFINDVLNKGIMLQIPPFCKDINPAKIIFLADKYGFQETPVTYTRTMPDGSRRVIRTETNCCIGAKYLFLLGKIPLDQMNCVEIGYINQFGTPSKNNSRYSKSQWPIGQTPIRWGEDETCNSAMSLGVDAVARLLGLYANSPRAINMMEQMLLTAEKPSAISEIPISTEEVIQSNNHVAMFRHMMGAIGYSLDEKDCGDQFREDRFPVDPAVFGMMGGDYPDGFVDEDEEDGIYPDIDDTEESEDDNVPSLKKIADDITGDTPLTPEEEVDEELDELELEGGECDDEDDD